MDPPSPAALTHCAAPMSPSRCCSPRVPAQTQLMFKWAEPKICSEVLPHAAQLPPSGLKTRCPPCNPGFYKSNSSSCEPCPYGSYSNGSGKEDPVGRWAPEVLWVSSLMSPLSPGCVRCPAGTEPVLGLEYKWWNVLPPNMETTVLSGVNFEYKGMAGTATPSPPRPRGAGDVTELSPCPCRLGGGRGLHLHSGGSL